MAKLEEWKISYIVWQNRALEFYLAARLLSQRELWSPACFSATQALELILKATLVYWDRSFNPKVAGHSFMKLERILRNKVKEASKVRVPEYFHFEGRYHSVSRYPQPGKGLGIPATFLDDLDCTFCELLFLVPFQFNSSLVHVLAGSDRPGLLILCRRNRQMRKLRRFLAVRLRK